MKEKGHMIMMRGCRKQKGKPGRIRGREGEYLKIRMGEISQGYSGERVQDQGVFYLFLCQMYFPPCLCGELRAVMEG